MALSRSIATTQQIVDWATSKTKRTDKAAIALEAINDLKDEFCAQPLFDNWKKGEIITLTAAIGNGPYTLPDDFGIPDTFVVELSDSWEYQLEEAIDQRELIMLSPYTNRPSKYFLAADGLYVGCSTPGQNFNLRPYYFKNIADYAAGSTIPLFVSRHGAKAYQYRAAAEIFEDIRMFDESQYYAQMADKVRDSIISKEMMKQTPVVGGSGLF